MRAPQEGFRLASTPRPSSMRRTVTLRSTSRVAELPWPDSGSTSSDSGLADDARGDSATRLRPLPDLAPLPEILARHDAALVCQHDAFAHYVAEAERQGTDAFPLYAWTKATIEDPVKKAKHLRSFTLHVAGAEVYSRAVADALEEELRPLVGGPVVAALSRHDTNPARTTPRSRSATAPDRRDRGRE